MHNKKSKKRDLAEGELHPNGSMYTLTQNGISTTNFIQQNGTGNGTGKTNINCIVPYGSLAVADNAQPSNTYAGLY